MPRHLIHCSFLRMQNRTIIKNNSLYMTSLLLIIFCSYLFIPVTSWTVSKCVVFGKGQGKYVKNALYLSHDHGFLRDADDPDNNDGNEDEHENHVQRVEKNEIASVRLKKKNSSFTVSDQRDSLPFLVKISTPDPYTNHEEMKQKALLNTIMDKQRHTGQNKTKKNKHSSSPHKHSVGDSIAASIYMRANNGSLQQILGEFHLDKATNCGDMIRVGDREYLVQKATCQYKYAGGKRFVMVRKILEVKETRRFLMEQMIQQNYDLPDEPNKDVNSFLE